MSFDNSLALFNRAKAAIPGGVNSPVRAFRSVGGTPVFMQSAKGAYLYDADGNSYVDYINSWGPMIMGHAYEPVTAAIQKKAEDSTSFGAPTLLEIEIAELIKEMVPNVDMIRMVNSGTEACMSALRLARGFTGRNKFIKFEGCYHGHADAFLVKGGGSGLATLDIQAVPGVTAGVSNDTLTAPYNDLRAVQTLIEEHDGEIAAIIVEPVAGNMGCVLPATGFLEGLRSLCDEHRIMLIFDEVMTGFRLAAGGAQEKLNVRADIITYGKVIGGGMPVGAFGARQEIMEHIAPLGKVYQAGTLSGNPIAMTAGFTLLSILNSNRYIYGELETKGQYLEDGLTAVMIEKGLPFRINRLGSMISVHFTDNDVTDFATSATCDIPMFNRLFHHMLNNGIYLPPSAYESWFMSSALSTADLDKTIDTVRSFQP
jgi:glutamate-1-semialdehyde 2,1-aminomutase